MFRTFRHKWFQSKSAGSSADQVTRTTADRHASPLSKLLPSARSSHQGKPLSKPILVDCLWVTVCRPVYSRGPNVRLGQKRRFDLCRPLPGLPRSTDIGRPARHVSKVPIGDKHCRPEEFLASTSMKRSFPSIVTGEVHFTAVCQSPITLYNLRLRLAVFRPTVLVFTFTSFAAFPRTWSSSVNCGPLSLGVSKLTILRQSGFSLLNSSLLA